MRGPLDRRWRRCICVASGPSLKFHPEQFEQVKAAQRDGWRVLVTNTTWKNLPDADVLFGADRLFWNAFGADVAAGFRGERWTGEANCAKAHGIHHIDTRYEVDKRTGLKGGLARDGSYIVHCGNSGAHIIALAYAFGMEIGIGVGFDFQHTGGTVNDDGILIGGPIHHHGPHVGTAKVRLSNPQPKALAGWAERMAPLARELAAAGVAFINCTTETALTCFERGDLAETIEKYREPECSR